MSQQPLRDNVARYERWGKWAAVLAVAGYLLLLVFGGEARFASLGDAVGPLTGALTALALFAAIEGVRLQREELKLQREELVLQRKELAESREVMREQARAAERSAETQERLAKAQEALAEAQKAANGLIWRDQNLRFVQDLTELDTRVAELAYERNSGLKVTPHPEFEKLVKVYQMRREMLLKCSEELSEKPSAPVPESQN